MTTYPEIHPDILEAFLDELPIGAIAVDDDGIIQRFNRYEEQLSGKSREEVIGQDFFSDIAPCTNDIEMGQKFRRGIAEGNLDLNFEFTFPYPYNRVARDVHIRAFSVEAAERHTNFLLIEEITSKRQLEQTNKEMLSGLRAILCGKRPASDVSRIPQTDGLGEESSAAVDGSNTVTQRSVCVFADLSSYRGVAEEVAPADLFGILDTRIRHAVRAIHRYGGSISEIAGDSVQAFFPLDEDEARPYYDALRAARDICDEPDDGHAFELPFRVGVSSGTIVQGQLGRDEFSQKATLGQPLTESRKLSSLAKPDEVIISAQVKDRCGDVIGTTELPRLPIAGLDRVSPVHRLETLDLPR